MPLSPLHDDICLVGNSSSRELSQCLTVAAITTFVRGQWLQLEEGRRRWRMMRRSMRGGCVVGEKSRLCQPLHRSPCVRSRNGTRFVSWRQGFCSADELAAGLGLHSPAPPPAPRRRQYPPLANAFFINTPAKSS